MPRLLPPTEEELFGDVKTLGEIDLGLLQMQVLWLLSNQSTHGYELMKKLTEMKKKRITQGTLYPTLQRLEELGYIRREEQDRKVVYHVTEKGNKVMNDTCVDFIRTFFGIIHDFACMKCLGMDKLEKKP